MRNVEQIMVSCSSEEVAALWWCLPSHNQRTPQVIKRVPWQKKKSLERNEFTTTENPWSNFIQIGLWFNCYDNTTVLHSYKYNAWELTPWSTRVGNNIKSFCFSKPPPLLSPMCHLLLLIAAHYHLLLRVFIITHSIRNSRKCQQGNIGVIFSWFIHIRSRSLGLTSKCDRMLLSLIQLMAGLLCTTNCVVFIEKFTQIKQKTILLKALNHVAL